MRSVSILTQCCLRAWRKVGSEVAAPTKLVEIVSRRFFAGATDTVGMVRQFDEAAAGWADGVGFTP